MTCVIFPDTLLKVPPVIWVPLRAKVIVEEDKEVSCAGTVFFLGAYTWAVQVDGHKAPEYRLMAYVCCYGNEFRFFQLRKEEKRGRKRGNLLDLPAPESEAFFTARRLQ
jgi:hypothetical protein